MIIFDSWHPSSTLEMLVSNKFIFISCMAQLENSYTRTDIYFMLYSLTLVEQTNFMPLQMAGCSITGIYEGTKISACINHIILFDDKLHLSWLFCRLLYPNIQNGNSLHLETKPLLYCGINCGVIHIYAESYQKAFLKIRSGYDAP